MKAKKGAGSNESAAEDFGLERLHQDYHRHGGPEGDATAKKLEGDIATAHTQHDQQLKKARPDSSGARHK